MLKQVYDWALQPGARDSRDDRHRKAEQAPNGFTNKLDVVNKGVEASTSPIEVIVPAGAKGGQSRRHRLHRAFRATEGQGVARVGGGKLMQRESRYSITFSKAVEAEHVKGIDSLGDARGRPRARRTSSRSVARRRKSPRLAARAPTPPTR